MNIIEKPVDELIPYENNPRVNDDAVPLVAESIRQFGFKVPIVIDRDNVIVTGHTRLKAAKQLGMKTVPCIIADDLTPEQVKAFRLADNKVAEFAEWDFSALETELSEITGLDMTAFGFDEPEPEQEQEEQENPTDALPESRLFVFCLSAFGVKSECFLEVALDPDSAERLLQRIKENGADAVAAVIWEALDAG